MGQLQDPFLQLPAPQSLSAQHAWHVPEQLLRPVGHTQEPFWQTLPPVQSPFPQHSWHVPEQLFCPDGQAQEPL
jgi:hypothetical protein